MSLWLLCLSFPGLAGEINCTEVVEGKQGERNNHRRPQWRESSRVKHSGSRHWQEATVGGCTALASGGERGLDFL